MIADDLQAVWDGFDRARFLTLALEGCDDLELTPRARHIAEALGDVLPGDRAEAAQVLVSSLGPENAEQELIGDPEEYVRRPVADN